MNRKTPNVCQSVERPSLVIPTILKGVVVSTNDPQQEGRILVHFPILGDKPGRAIHSTSVDHFKWVPYAPMIGGMSDDDLMRGPGEEGQTQDNMGTKSTGKAAYGWWSIPRKNAIVFCFLANGDPNDIHWFACKYPTKSSATLFGGRFTNNGGTIDGPWTIKDQPIQPVYENLTEAYGSRSGNYEWISRGADYNPSMISEADVRAELHRLNKKVDSKKFDKVNDSVTEPDGTQVGRTMKYTQGYARSRSEPTKDTNNQHEYDRLRATEQNSESTMHGFTTPGGHYISFDDRPEQNRVKIRTSTGHTLLMDDTNDRIYLATNRGGTWFEMDSNGHIYFFSDESTSFLSNKHMNFTANGTLRFWGKEGIHMVSQEGEFRLHAKDVHVKSSNWMHQTNNYDFISNVSKSNIRNWSVSTSKTIIESTSFNLSGEDANLHFSKVFNQYAEGKFSIRSNAVLALDGSTLAYQAGASSVASTTPSPEVVEPKLAYWTNITPKHEPWARTFNGSKDVDELYNHEPEFSYDSSEVNRDMKQQQSDYTRGPLWRR